MEKKPESASGCLPPPDLLPKTALEDGEEREDPGGAQRGGGLEHLVTLLVQPAGLSHLQ